ncbi:hypothetical protein F7725_012588, partial [Dissostichus mawsoni]
MKFMEMLPKDLDYYGTLLKKLAPPLVTLLSAEPELQYVALRNINLIVQRRPEILKHEMKVFFVKYNDPIYVKLEKLDIMIRLASQANIAQVLAELKEYATEVDVDFVRKAVRAIGRCAIKVEQSAERCVSTLLDLIQTKVNYVVQEAIVVIKDIFRKYPNKYSLDEPEARAAMIWIVGEYAERIDNADELLESFLEGFHDESTQVQLQLLTAIVKLFLKKPTETQELVQQVLSLATQDSDNPDLRDRGYIYWRLLSTDPVAAKEVVLAEKPLISEETDLIEPTLLEELICHIGTLASVYHKPPSAFVEGSRGVQHKRLTSSAGSGESVESPDTGSAAVSEAPPSVIPSQGDLLGDLLNLDLTPPSSTGPPPAAAPGMQLGAMDLLGGGLDSLMGDESEPLGGDIGGSPAMGAGFGAPPAAMPASFNAPISGGLDDLFDLGGGGAMKAKGLEISGTFVRRSGVIQMEMTLNNKAMSVMSDFAIQFNRNSFGLAPAGPLQILTPISPNQSIEAALPLSTVGPVMKMEPLNNLQVAVKNNIDVFYFSCQYPISMLFLEDGKMERQVFLATWKDIPNENESQFQIKDCHLNSGSNIFTIAKRTVEGQDMLYQSMKLTNGIWVLAELRVQAGNPNYTSSGGFSVCFPELRDGAEELKPPHPPPQLTRGPCYNLSQCRSHFLLCWQILLVNHFSLSRFHPSPVVFLSSACRNPFFSVWLDSSCPSLDSGFGSSAVSESRMCATLFIVFMWQTGRGCLYLLPPPLRKTNTLCHLALSALSALSASQPSHRSLSVLWPPEMKVQ